MYESSRETEPTDRANPVVQAPTPTDQTHDKQTKYKEKKKTGKSWRLADEEGWEAHSAYWNPDDPRASAMKSNAAAEPGSRQAYLLQQHNQSNRRQNKNIYPW